MVASHCMVLLFLSIFSLLVLSSSPVHGWKDGSWHTVRPSSLLPATTCSSSSSKAPNATKLHLFHRYGPCSPIHHHEHPSHLQILDHDQSRAAAIHRRASNPNTTTNSLAATIPNHDGSSLGTGNYIVTVGLGSPRTDYTLAFDTGSDLTWTQCKPCTDCYAQQDPVFDPSQSTTYTYIRCRPPASCNHLGLYTSCSVYLQCRYTITYEDKSRTEGSLSQDTLTLTPSDIVPSFTFGCGDSNSGLFGESAGFIGLGRGELSLPSQTKQTYNGVFSYCIPSTGSSSGYLKLGGDPPRNTQFTPMLSGYVGSGSYYYLNLVSISVGGQRLPVSPSVFSRPGTILDSGTVISRLPPAAYSAMRAEFRRRMAMYPMAPALSHLDTCYDLSGYDTAMANIPVVALQFGGGVTLRLDVSGTVYAASTTSQVCLAFAATDDPDHHVIIGNTQQKKYSVVYDLPNKRIGFSLGGCN